MRLRLSNQHWIGPYADNALKFTFVAELEEAGGKAVLAEDKHNGRHRRDSEQHDHRAADNSADAARRFWQVADIKLFLSFWIHHLQITAGSTRVPAAFGFGSISTRPLITLMLKVGTFSANGGGEAPESGKY